MTRSILMAVCLVSGMASFWGARICVERLSNGQPEDVNVATVEASKFKEPDGENPLKQSRGVRIRDDEGRSVGLEALLERLAEIERNAGSLADSRLAVMEAIQGMNAAELKLLVENAVESSDFLRMLRFDIDFAARRLGEIAPEEAGKLWEKNGSNVFLANTMLAPWASRDPQAFAAWVKGLPKEMQNSAGWAVSAMARDKPEQFTMLAPLLGDSPAGPSGAKAAIEKMISDAGEKGDPGVAFAYAARLPEGPIRDKALVGLAKWPGLDLAQHPEILAALGQLSLDAARQIGAQIYANAEKLPSGAVRETAFATLIKADADKDPALATKRLDTLAGSSDYPAAVVGFVGATASKDPAAAADWALSIGAQADGKRMEALGMVAQAWFKKNEEEARAWVEKAPLSDREYFILTGRNRVR